MAGAKEVATRYPGVYKRGSRYLYAWTDTGGKRRKATAETLDQARAAKADRERDAREGTPVSSSTGRLTFARFARELYGAEGDRPDDREPLRGRFAGRRGAVRDRTRSDYRRQIEVYWLPALAARPLDSITPADLRRVIDKLAARDGDAYLADATLRRVFCPMGALLATAAEEGLVPANVSRDVRLPSGRDRLRRFAADDDEDGEDARGKALTREEVDVFLAIVDPRHGTFFRLLAETGMRFSEIIALRHRDVVLDGAAPNVRVRRACVRGVFGPPKTKHSERTIPLGRRMVDELRARHRDTEWPGPDDLVFASTAGTPLVYANMRTRTLRPAAEEAGVAWAGFHSFRHFNASMQIAQGRNVVQVSRWLGHHSPAFTRSVYAHLLDDGVGAPLDLFGGAEGGRWGDVEQCESVRSSPTVRSG